MNIVKGKVRCQDPRDLRGDSAATGAKVKDCVVEFQRRLKHWSCLAVELASQRNLRAVHARERHGGQGRIKLTTRDSEGRGLRARVFPRDTRLGIVRFSQID